MDKKSTSFLALGLMIGAVLTAGVFSLIVRNDDGQSKQVLKLAHALPEASAVHRAMVFMAERLDELSGGSMEIQVFPNEQLGAEAVVVEQMQKGAIAMIKSSAGPMEKFIPEMGVFGVPYLFRSEEHYWNILNGDIGKEMLVMGTSQGIRGICYYDGGARSFYTKGKAVLEPGDLVGMKIRVMKSATAMDMINTFGGSPAPIPFGELYSALQQGIVDGAENNPPSMYDSRHWEQAKHYSLDEHSRIPDIVMFSEKIWNRLSPTQQAWVQQAADESVVYQKQVWKEYVEECLKKLEENGVTIYTPDQSKFQEAAQSMYKQFDGTVVEPLIEAIQNTD